MKDWLTVIIVLLIIGIVLDGVRRMRLARRESIKLSKNAKKADLEADLPTSTSEFPSGGARVASLRDEDDVDSLNKSVKEKFEAGKTNLAGARRIPEQVSLNLEESVPMLMDSVSDEVMAEDEPNFTAKPYLDQREPEIGSLEDLQDDTELLEDDEDGDVSVQVRRPEQKATVSSVSAQAKADIEGALDRQSDVSSADPEEVLIVNVMAKPEQRFAGEALLHALMDQGLKLGDMDIFHRHQQNDGDAPVVFSLANMVVPGTFNLSEMEVFETPGVSLFLSLPAAGENLAAYDDMIATAKKLAESLDGELKDENRSVMTSQTIEHGRQRVIEFERKQKLHH